MRTAWYEQQGPARAVLTVGEIPDPTPGPGRSSDSDRRVGHQSRRCQKRQNAFGYGMPYPRIIPHSDGAGVVDQVGAGVPIDWLGRRV